MAVRLEPWLYITRGSVAFAVLTTVLALPLVFSQLGTARPVRYKLPPGFPLLFVFLGLLYLGDLTALVVESLSRGELPDTTASVSETMLFLAIVIHPHQLAAQEKTSIWHIHCTSWLLLLLVELMTATARLGLPPSPSPYHQLGIILAALRALTYPAILVLFLRAIHRGYRSLDQSDPGTTEDSHDATGDDPLGIRMEATEEIKQLGGWWPFLKKFHIFLRFMWPNDPVLQLRFVLAFITVVARRVVSLLLPLQTAILIDAAGSGDDVWHPFLVLVCLKVANSNMFLSTIRGLLWVDVNLHRTAKLKVESHSKIMRSDTTFLSLAHPTDLTSAVDFARSVDKLLDSLIFNLALHLLTFVFAVVSLYHRFGPLMVIILTHMTALYLVIEKTSLTVLTRERDRYITVNANKERRRHDGVRGWKTVFNHNRTEHEISLFASEVGSWVRQLRRYWLFSYAFGSMKTSVLYSGRFAAYAYVLYKIHSGEGTIGDLVAFEGLWNLLLGPIDYFSSVVGDLLEELLNAARLRRIMERESRVEQGVEELVYRRGDVQFQNVAFSYPGASEIISDMNITIRGGSKVALVGPSGVGKSTIFELAMGMLRPTRGAVLIDGQDIATVSQDSLHKHVGMVLQSPYIFNTTILDNLRFVKPDATDEEIYDACGRAEVHETIIGRRGQYNTLAGERGQNLSGGEQQRLALARMFLQRPDILFIDEGTSSLDPDTEDIIKKNIEQSFDGRTVIVIAHRLSSIRHFDRILVLGKGGKIVEDGDHDTLVAKNGVYAESWRKHAGVSL